MVAQVRAEKLNASAGVHNGALTISENSKQLIMGCGTGDVFLKNSKSGRYLQFYDDGTLRIDGVVIGSISYEVCTSRSGKWFNRVPVIANDGVIELGRYIDFHYSSSGTEDYSARMEIMDWDCINFSGAIRCNGVIYPGKNLQPGWDIGTSGSRFYTVYCNNVNQSSDKSLKENIQYVDDNRSVFSRMRSNTPFKDFLSNDLKIATYTYKRENKLSATENLETIDLEQKQEDNQIGFIAQDIAETAIGSTFVYGEEGSMNYSPSGFTAVVAKALQETIKELDDLKEENKESK